MRKLKSRETVKKKQSNRESLYCTVHFVKKWRQTKKEKESGKITLHGFEPAMFTSTDVLGAAGNRPM